MLCRRASGYACPRPECDYFGNPDPTFHALVGDGKRSADGIQFGGVVSILRHQTNVS